MSADFATSENTNSPSSDAATENRTLGRRKLTFRHSVVGAMLLLVATALISFGFAGRSFFTGSAVADESPDRRMPVNVVQLEYADAVKQERRFTGMVKAKSRSDLGFELSGKIVSVFVDEGDTLSAGAALAQLDTDSLIAQKNGILARIEEAKTFLAELEAGPRSETIKAARANRDAAKSDLDLAQINFHRRESLKRRGAVSTEEFDQADFALKTAQANLKAAEERLAELESGTRQEKIDAQKALVKQLDASLEEIEVAITKSTLLSPFAGTVTRRYLDPGSVSQPSQPVVRLVDESHLEAWIGLPVATAAELNLSDRVEIYVDEQPRAATLTAKIRELDTETRTQTVIFRFDDNEVDAVVSGQLCDIRIESRSELSGYWVPTSALAKGVRGLWSLLALVPADDGFRVEKRDVEVIHTQTDRVLVRGTLVDGDQVVTDGVHRVTNGQLVEPIGPGFVAPR
jgi:multidrug resistance efflux pump